MSPKCQLRYPIVGLKESTREVKGEVFDMAAEQVLLVRYHAKDPPRFIQIPRLCVYLEKWHIIYLYLSGRRDKGVVSYAESCETIPGSGCSDLCYARGAQRVLPMKVVGNDQSILTNGSRRKLNANKTIAHNDVTHGLTACRHRRKSLIEQRESNLLCQF